METSTTSADNPNTGDDTADVTTATDPQAGTDQQTAGDSDNLNQAESTTSGESEDTTSTDDTPASNFDEDLDDWIVKRGHKAPETDDERTSYQELRTNQREFTREQQAKKSAADAKALGEEIHNVKPEDISEDDDEIDPLEKKINDLTADRDAERATRQQSEYVTTNKVSTEEVTAMGIVLKEMIEKEDTPEEKRAAHAYWTNPKRLEQWHKLAKANMSDPTTDTQIAVDEAQQAERVRIAKESKANSPGRGATTTTSGNKSPEQQRLERFSNWG